MKKLFPVILLILGIIAGIVIHSILYIKTGLAISTTIILVTLVICILIMLFMFKRNLDKANDKLELMSHTDELSHVFNRKYLFEILEKEISRDTRHGGKFCCILVKINKLSAINDQFGWEAGDTVLKGVADILKDSLRKSDIVGRYDNNQYLCLLIESDLEHALIIAKRLGALIAGERFDTGRTGHFFHASSCIGVTAWRPSVNHVIEMSDLIKTTETALSKAVQSGENTVKSCSV